MAEADNMPDHDMFDPTDVARQHGVERKIVDDAAAAARKLVSERRDAYTRFFGGAPTTGDRDLVMKDLKRFCRGGLTPWEANGRETARITGRNEVWQRIQQHTTLSLDELVELLSGGA